MARRVSTPQIVEATKAYIRQNPWAGKERIREAVKTEYNTAPSNKAILDLKREVLGLSPNVVYRGWRAAGFTKEEANELVRGSKGVKVDYAAVYSSQPGIQARDSRRQWILGLLQRGWTPRQIAKEARAYYLRDKKRNPFDFIKIEYKPPQKADYKEYRERSKAKARIKVRALYGRGK